MCCSCLLARRAQLAEHNLTSPLAASVAPQAACSTCIYVSGLSTTTLSCNLSCACSDPHHEFGGLNCLIVREGLACSAREAGVSREDASQKLAAAREKLHSVRAKRPRPHLDDKVGISLGLPCQALCNRRVNHSPAAHDAAQLLSVDC